MFQYVPPAFDQSFNLKFKGQVFVLSHQGERMGSTVHCNANRK